MTTMNLANILEKDNLVEIKGPGIVEIESVVYDSRKAALRTAFCALPGAHTDGHNYIEQAADNGCAVIIHQKSIKIPRNGVTYVQVSDSRIAMSRLAHVLHNKPVDHLGVIGVTGTDGKSSCVWFITQLLELAGVSTGFISTVEYKSGQHILPNPYRQSTPESPEIHKLLDSMIQNGNAAVCIEATSHGLSRKHARLEDVFFDAALFTNISREHFEFHGNVTNYLNAKLRLFKKLKNYKTDHRPFGVVCVDSDHSKDFIQASDKPVYTYSIKQKADLYAEITQSDAAGSSIRISDGNETRDVRLPIPGDFNVQNALGALLLVSRYCGIPWFGLASKLRELKPLKGRLELIDCGQPFTVVCDYAHTPGSFEKVLPLLNTVTKGRLITVFGSAGERDIGKRAIQGEIADRYSDSIILTDEDPRQEDRLSILRDIQEGITNKKEGEQLFLVPDREAAIKKALESARPDDTVALLGKGHETSIIGPQGPLPWDEAAAAAKILTEMFL